MKKTILFVSLLLASTIFLNAQNYLIGFEGTGASVTVDSIQVTNLMRGTTLTVKSGHYLKLVSVQTSLNRFQAEEQNVMKIYPNPMQAIATVEFSVTGKDATIVEVLDMSGLVLAHYSAFLEVGAHKVQLSGLNEGIYTITLSNDGKLVSQKVVSHASVSSSASISYVGFSQVKKASDLLKGAVLEQEMLFAAGDRFLMKGFAAEATYANTVIDIPESDKTEIFNFTDCTDGDGNNYGTVTIGTQTWMTENLKSTTYNDHTAISSVTNTASWAAVTTPAYCWFNNDAITYKNIYGALYNWFVVDAISNGGKNVCPASWHVPTDEEWTILTDYLGGASLAGGKMKETGTSHWASSNVGADNSSGFTAVGSGNRVYNGSFINAGSNEFWWTASTYYNSSSIAWYRYVGFNNATAGRDYYGYFNLGFNVRCIKEIATIKK